MYLFTKTKSIVKKHLHQWLSLNEAAPNIHKSYCKLKVSNNFFLAPQYFFGNLNFDVFHFSAVFGPNGQRGTTSTENFSIERPIFVAPPPPPSPNGGTQTFYPAFRAISNLHFFSHHNIFSEI